MPCCVQEVLVYNLRLAERSPSCLKLEFKLLNGLNFTMYNIYSAKCGTMEKRFETTDLVRGLQGRAWESQLWAG